MMKEINDRITNNHHIMEKMKINRVNKFNLLKMNSYLRIVLPLFIILVLAAFRVNAQLPVITVRFANPDYNCTDQTYCLDVEFRSNTAGQQLFGMNVRFYYDDNVLELISFSNYQGGYGTVSPNPPEVITGSPASGPDLFGFTGPAEFINGAIQLVSAGDPIIISTTGWTKLFSICFDVVDPDALNTENFCPGVVWDLEENPADGGFSTGSEGVVITVVDPDPNLDSSPATENVVQFNWSYDGVAGIPYGALSPTICIPTDPDPPVITGCPTEIIDLNCNPATLPDCDDVLALGITASDECSGPITPVCEAGQVIEDNCMMTQTFTLTATDDNGNSSYCDVTYTWVVDTEAPVFSSCPAGIVDLGCTPLAFPDEAMAIAEAGTATDNCDQTLDYSAVATSDPVNDGCEWTQTWTVTAATDCGPDATCEVTFTWVIDTGEPIFSGCPQDPIDLGCNPTTMPDCDDVLALGITASDGCAGPLTPVCTTGPVTGDDCLKTQTFALTATDDDNNTATCEVIYTWTVDSDSPVFSYCPVVDIFIGCNPETMPVEADVLADAGIAVDNCDQEISYSAAPEGSPAGEGCWRYQTWTVTAAPECGPDATCDVTYKWTVDTEAPAFTVPEDITIYFDQDCEYDASPDSTGHVTVMEDNCSTELNPTWEDVVDDTDPCAVVITRTWSLADECGNRAEDQVQLITVMDTIAPTFNAPPDITIYANEDLSYDARPTYTGSTTDKHDNCYVGYADYEDEVVETGGEDTIAVITRTWSLEDDCGNQAEDQIQIITVRKTPPVVVNCTKQEYCIRQNGLYILSKADMNALAGYAGGVPEGVEITVTPDYFTCDDVGEEIPVTVTATDKYGNTDQCTTTVIVCDEIAPVITPPDDIVVAADPGECDAIVDFAAEVTDNCSATVTYSHQPGTSFPAGTTTVTATATDIGGNAVSCEFDITVTDDGAPLINCPDLITVYVAENEGGASVDFEATASDQCGDVTISYSIEPGTFLEFGYTTVTATATDESGNQASCNFDILVTFDANPPVVDNPVIDTTINIADTTKLPLAPIFNDPDDDDLTIEAEQEDGNPLPDWIHLTGDTLVFTPSPADSGCVSIVVTATSPGLVSTSDTFQVCASDLTGIDYLFPGVFEVIMYPNPTPGKVTIDLTPDTRDDIELIVLDITGKLVLQKQYSPSGRILFDLSNNATGMYFVHLEFGGVHLVKKLVVDRR